MVGDDDYLSVLKAVRSGLTAWRAQAEAEFVRAGLKP